MEALFGAGYRGPGISFNPRTEAQLASWSNQRAADLAEQQASEAQRPQMKKEAPPTVPNVK